MNRDDLLLASENIIEAFRPRLDRPSGCSGFRHIREVRRGLPRRRQDGWHSCQQQLPIGFIPRPGGQALRYAAGYSRCVADQTRKCSTAIAASLTRVSTRRNLINKSFFASKRYEPQTDLCYAALPTALGRIYPLPRANLGKQNSHQRWAISPTTRKSPL